MTIKNSVKQTQIFLNAQIKKIIEKYNYKIYNKEKLKECKKMTKMAESLGAVYIYIYIVRFNRISLCEHRRKTMLFRRTKIV